MSSSAAEMQLPSSYPTVPSAVHDEIKLVKLAREVAMGIKPLKQVVEEFGISTAEWVVISQNAWFNQILSAEIEAWGAAQNTAERVKLKSASMIEEFLPEAYKRLNDRSENLNHKVELLKTVVNLSQLGGRAGVDVNGDPARSVTVTINLGADTQLNYQRKAPAPPTIDITPNAPPMSPTPPTPTDDPSLSADDFSEL